MLFSIRATQADLQNYSNFLGYAFLASIGEYNSYTESSDNFDALSFIIFIMISIVNTIIMMNLLISIISDTYDKVQLRIGVANLIELIKMTVEVESILYWNKNKKERVYVQRVLKKNGIGGNKNEAWEGRIKEIKNEMENIGRNMQENIQKVNENMKNALKVSLKEANDTVINKVGELDKKIDMINEKLDSKIEALAKKFDIIVEILKHKTELEFEKEGSAEENIIIN